LSAAPRHSVGSDRLHKSARLALIVLLPLAGCGSAERNGATAAAPAGRVVVLALLTGPEGTAGAPIHGTVPCETGIDPLCNPDDGLLAEAVLQCGGPRVTIDRSTSHVAFVYFPAGLHERFPRAIPSDLDIVRCVRGRVGMRFSAGLADDDDPDRLMDADERPFRSLHAPRPAGPARGGGN
jgi:hypothetical protein